MKKLLAMALIGVLSASAAWAEDMQVGIKDHAFTPAELTISTGTKVTWTNHDQDPHTVVQRGAPSGFHSSALDTNDSYSYTFTTPGTYTYFCTLHPAMVGKITVTAGK